MNEPLFDDDLLLRYLDDELPVMEKRALEERLRTDASLQEKLEKLQVAIQAVRQLGTTQQVAAIHAGMMKELKPVPAHVVSFRKPIRITLAVAASLFVVFAGVRLYLSSQASPEKVYSDVFIDFNVSAARGSEENMSVIEKHYGEGNYTAVLSDVHLINMDPKDSLLLGLSYLKTSRTNQAVGILQRLAASTNEFQQDAEFYLSLAHLKIKNYDASLNLLKKIQATPTHLYHERVSDDTLQDLEELRKR